MKPPFYEGQSLDEQQARLNKMIRQQHAMDSMDSLAPLVVIAMFVIAGIAYCLLH
jgi:hypothetical protein